MIKTFVLDALLPMLVCGGLGGFLLFTLLARLVYDHLETHYHDILSPAATHGLLETDSFGGYMADVWRVARSGEWRRIESAFWRGMLWFSMSAGGTMLVSLTGLMVIFMFPRWWR
ncbi:hypothetical protein [Jeongeupia naejangsanensis]|uniref:Uncharacterized protein n=1 Tax=Jeongeupia naejangsanensis TaxID=613195 RepID=A0ABS2BLT3_9NEIS|nr:hypothetical protein [Jeongeupia naejangsanensis]MBM3116048.1 hypothetical protein [Jeongeupia naejangsanensis]